MAHFEAMCFISCCAAKSCNSPVLVSDTTSYHWNACCNHPIWIVCIVQVRLILKEKLDRETEAVYTMRLIAVDGGPNPKTGSTTVQINVLDSNDNKPKFVGGTSFNVSIVENTAPGTVILRIKAVDGDDGPNGQIAYSFARSTLNSAAGQAFTMRNNTGEIVVQVRLNSAQYLYQLLNHSEAL